MTQINYRFNNKNNNIVPNHLLRIVSGKIHKIDFNPA